MSQNATDVFDLSAGMDFDVTAEEIHKLASELESHEVATPESDEEAAGFVTALKRLEKAAEEARKETFEPALAHIESGDSIADLQKRSGSNRYVTDHESAFDAVLDAGKDPREVAKVSASKLESVLGESATEFVGESEYEYFVRQS